MIVYIPETMSQGYQNPKVDWQGWSGRQVSHQPITGTALAASPALSHALQPPQPGRTLDVWPSLFLKLIVSLPNGSIPNFPVFVCVCVYLFIHALESFRKTHVLQLSAA